MNIKNILHLGCVVIFLSTNMLFGMNLGNSWPNPTLPIPNASAYEQSPLLSLARRGNCDQAKLLMNHYNINLVDDKGYSPLHYACFSGSVDTVNLLIAHGAEVNVLNALGPVSYSEISKKWKNKIATPLHCAVGVGSTEIIKLLLDAGADIDSTYHEDGNTPLHIAAWRGFNDCLEFLVQQGADFNVPNNHGSTPLHTSAWRNHAKCLTLLLDHGANFTQRNNTGSGNTPLFLAAKSGSVDCLKILLERDNNRLASINLTCALDKTTPLQVSAARLKLQCCWLLIKAGACHHFGCFKYGESLSDFTSECAMANHFFRTIEEYGTQQVPKITERDIACGICQQAYSQDDVIVSLSTCQDSFHYTCFKNGCIDNHLEAYLLRGTSGYQLSKNDMRFRLHLSLTQNILASQTCCPACYQRYCIKKDAWLSVYA